MVHTITCLITHRLLGHSLGFPLSLYLSSPLSRHAPMSIAPSCSKPATWDSWGDSYLLGSLAGLPPCLWLCLWLRLRLWSWLYLPGLLLALSPPLVPHLHMVCMVCMILCVPFSGGLACKPAAPLNFQQASGQPMGSLCSHMWQWDA